MTLAGAHGIMTSTAYARARYIASRKDSRRVKLQSKMDPEDMSILASVMGVTGEVSIPSVDLLCRC